MITYECINQHEAWECSIEIKRYIEPYEMNICSDGNLYHVLIGSHSHGNFICIPNWEIGCELAGLSDSFWNIERLTKHVGPRNAISIAEGLKLIKEALE